MVNLGILSFECDFQFDFLTFCEISQGRDVDVVYFDGGSSVRAACHNVDCSHASGQAGLLLVNFHLPVPEADAIILRVHLFEEKLLVDVEVWVEDFGDGILKNE